MTALAFDLRDSGAAPSAAAPRRLRSVAPSHDPVAGTLDALLTAAFTSVGAGSEAPCPVCPGTMQPRWSANSGANGGRCADCGSTLS